MWRKKHSFLFSKQNRVNPSLQLVTAMWDGELSDFLRNEGNDKDVRFCLCENEGEKLSKEHSLALWYKC